MMVVLKVRLATVILALAMPLSQRQSSFAKCVRFIVLISSRILVQSFLPRDFVQMAPKKALAQSGFRKKPWKAIKDFLPLAVKIWFHPLHRLFDLIVQNSAYLAGRRDPRLMEEARRIAIGCGRLYIDLSPQRVGGWSSVDCVHNNFRGQLPVRGVQIQPQRSVLGLDLEKNSSRTWTTSTAVEFDYRGIVIRGATIMPSEKTVFSRNPYHLSGLDGDFVDVSEGGKTRILIRRCAPTTLVPQAILAMSRAPENWFHALLQVIATVVTIPEHIPASVPILVQESIPSELKKVLVECTTRKIVYLKIGEVAAVNEAFWRTTPVEVEDSIWFDTPQYFAVDEPALLRMRQLLIKASLSMSSNFSPPKRVFLMRHGPRTPKNLDRLVKIAFQEGFEPVDLISLPWHDQVRLFRSAEVIVLPGGAAMANLLFSKAGQQIVQLTSPAFNKFPAPHILAGIAGANLFTLAGKSVMPKVAAETAVHWAHSDYRVNERKFRKILSTACERM